MSDISGGTDPLKEVVEQIKREAYAAGWHAAIESVMSAVAAVGPPDGSDASERSSFVPVPQRQAADSGTLTVGTTPHYVYQAVQRKQGMTGAEVIAAVHAEGHTVAEAQIRTALSRLEKRQLLANRHRKWFLK